MLAKKMLERNGFKVTAVSNGVELVAAAMDGVRYDGILTDLNMPVMVPPPGVCRAPLTPSV